VAYLLFADWHTYVCRTWSDLAARLVWARQQGYATAKARQADATVAALRASAACRGRHSARARLTEAEFQG